MIHVLAVLAQLAATPTPATPDASAPKPLSQEVLVEALRADDETPVTFTGLDRAALDAASYGQEMPFVLGRTPSITFQSDSGVAGGYSYFSLRGISMTRVNMTWDGVPLNDPEDAGVYFSNAGGFVDAAGTVQIQRGVATSSVGAPAYGGAIAFESLAPSDERRLAIDAGGGSYDSRRAAATAHTGRLSGGPAFWARGAFTDTDGYRHHSGMRQEAGFFGGNWQAPSWVAALSGFHGVEDSSLAFVPSTAEALVADPRDNPLQPDEVDHFRQDLIQAQWAHRVGGQGTFVAQAYSNGVYGWYRLWADPITRTELDEYHVDGRMLGARTSLELVRGPWRATVALHAATFARDHSLVAFDERKYLNTGHKDEGNGFIKVAWTPAGWRVDGEAQLRQARFRYEGDVAIAPITWTFLNGRAGVRRDWTERVSVYATAGHVTREPARNDLFAGEDNPSVAYDLHAVRPEKATGFELGIETRGRKASLRANVYAMELRDEIALTGELSPIGLLLRRNVDRSFRRGLEVEGFWQAFSRLRMVVAGEAGAARIRDWEQFYPLVDAQGAALGSTSRRYSDVPALLSPNLVVNAEADWQAAREVAASLHGRYVSRSYLDNTGDPAFSTPPFFDLQAVLTADFSRFRPQYRPRLRVFVNNLFDRRIWPSGLSETTVVRDAAGRDTVSGTGAFFPLAGRNVYVVGSVEWGGR
jgi:iron complex outermembrane receptor protein